MGRPMSENVKTLTSQAAPWSKQVAWWIVVVEGGVALVLGLFVLFRPEQANTRFIQVIGGYLVVTSALALYRIVAHKDEAPGEPGRWVRVGVGLVAGLIALFHPRMPTIDTAAATTVLAVGMLLSGALGLYGVFATRAQAGGMRWGDVIANGLYLLFAFAVFRHNRADTEASGDLVWWIGILTTAAGAGLIYYGLRLRSAAEAAVVAVAAADAPAAVPAEPAASNQSSPDAAKELADTKEPAGGGAGPPQAAPNRGE
jgi:uncharacterized membrane protein HdeD (DUF308 family)